MPIIKSINSMALIFIASLFLSASVSEARNVEQAVLEFFKDDGRDLMTGHGSFLHYTFKEAIDFEDFTRHVRFESDTQKQQFKDVMRSQFGVDFNLKAPEEHYEILKLYFDGDKVRKDVSLDLKIDLAKQLRAKPDMWTNQRQVIHYARYVYDGEKTISVHDQGEFSDEPEVTITSSKIWTPDFRAFGRNNSGKDTQVFIDAINNGDYELLSQKTESGYVADMFLSQIGVTMRIEFGDNISYRPKSLKLLTGDAVAAETVFGPYVKLQEGSWFPSSIAEIKYVFLDGRSIMSYKDEYILLSEDIDFNCDIPQETFDPKIPIGAHVIDFSKNPKKPFVMESKDSRMVAELPDIDLSVNSGESRPAPTYKSVLPQKQKTADKPIDLERTNSTMNNPAWSEWGLPLSILVASFSFMAFLAYRKYRKGRKNAK